MNQFFNRITFDKDQLVSVAHHNTQEPIKGYYHYHEAFEFLIIHQGSGKVVVNQRTYDLSPGNIFVFQPFQLHIVYPTIEDNLPYERTIVHFDAVGIDAYASAFPAFQTFYHFLWRHQLEEQRFDMSKNLPFVKQLCKQLAQYSETDRDGRILLLLQLISSIRELYGNKAFTPQGINPTAKRYSEQVMQWIEEHYTEEFELSRLAEAMHLSKNYISRIFRQETGTSIMEYVMARRIKEACKLLQTTEWTVERIGTEVGLSNTSYFVQLFKRIVGTTPLQYRKTYATLGEAWGFQ